MAGRTGGSSSSNTSVYKSSDSDSLRNNGSRESSVYKSSAELYDYSCDPCNRAGDHFEAEGYCTDCEEYLCATCFKSHSRSKVSQTHVLLNKANMPKKSVFCGPCKMVGDEEEAAGFCTDCVEHLCSSCYKSHSRSKASRHHILIDRDNMPDNKPDSDVLSSFAAFGVSEKDATFKHFYEEYFYFRDINVKADDDEKDCYITGMTLLPNTTHLILGDYNNKSLKLVDLENNVVKGNLRLRSVPFGITAISQGQVAVVCTNECKIYIASVSTGLSIERCLRTDGKCIGTKFTNDKLYVSFCEPVKFQILRLTGAVQKTIKPDSVILKHCTFPAYIAVSPDESIIYLSDWKNNKVLSLDMNGNMISMYQGELDLPSDISISPHGYVYLCNRNQHVVYKMTSDLSEATVVLVKGDGLDFPDAMCFNVEKKQLYFSSGSSEAEQKNFIKMFKNN